MNKVKRLRVESVLSDLKSLYYKDNVKFDVSYTVDKEKIPFDKIDSLEFKPIYEGTQWGNLWDSAWFKFSVKMPKNWDINNTVALIDLGGEGCVFKNGYPFQGITYKLEESLFELKRRLHAKHFISGDNVAILVEAAANGMLGDAQWGQKWPFFTLNQAELAIFDYDMWQLTLDIDFLLKLYDVLDANSVRAKRIMNALQEVCNIDPVNNAKKALEITYTIINNGVNSSALTTYSIGHAHIDVAWLWRYKETRRKTGRTFSTALRMMEEYPEYIFGASQPQIFDWLKEDYPKLYEEVKEKVKAGRFECQGGMWVEPDMNITSGESLVRQCFYGKKFFRDEFNKEINFLWLPDVFGYSAAIPQILKKANIDYFITQKISWNETNVFPYHTFDWYGIDGTKIVSHFLPTNDYNCDNTPKKIKESGERFAHGDTQDGYLNLYGIGDGGGGPSRRHIEFGKRSQNCEGLDKVVFSTATEFLNHLQMKQYDLPAWRGELYLELHRGTYTTQAKTKKNNRKMEHRLRDVEFLSSILINMLKLPYQKKEIERIWKETLTNQFHDVLPGSSIKEVYEDEHEISDKNFNSLSEIQSNLLNELFEIEDDKVVTLINTQPWSRFELVEHDGRYKEVKIPSMGYVTFQKDEFENTRTNKLYVSPDNKEFSNNILSVKLDDNGSVVSIRKDDIEFISSEKANVFKLYEDKPFFWDAWDVNEYYMETTPEIAKLVASEIVEHNDYVIKIKQKFSVGKSKIEQILELRKGEDLLRIKCHVAWYETKKMLRYVNGTTILSDVATYEIQYGSLKRPTHSNTSWDEAKFEVCAHRYADLSQEGKGIALINDCKFGYRIHANIMELNLLRSPLYPDETADRGEHVFDLGLYPHNCSYSESDVIKVSHNFNSDLIMLEKRKSKEVEVTYASFSKENVKIEVIKPAEYCDGLVIRMYENLGMDCTGAFETKFTYDTISEIDLEERNEVLLANNVLSFKPFEIKTILLK